MVKILIALVPAALAAIGYIPLLSIALLWKKQQRRNGRKSPLTRDLLRPPGYSLREKIDDLSLKIGFYLLSLQVLPLLVFAVHVSQSYFTHQPETIFRIVLSVATGICIATLAGWRLLPLLHERKLHVLGLEGELATGEELNQLMLDGCRVFHDIPFPYGNIDHVVVSQSGVFSVNSKMLGKPMSGEGKAEITVDQQLGIVQFPDREYRIPFNQFEAEATWLAQHLTSAVGQQVKVESILALPGWFVKGRIGRGPVYVINPRSPKKFFVQNRQVLVSELIQQVAHQLEQLCRNIRPSFRNERERWEEAR